MAAYLFAHFIGEQKDGEQIYFAVSQDGRHWKDLNGEIRYFIPIRVPAACGIRFWSEIRRRVRSI